MNKGLISGFGIVLLVGILAFFKGGKSGIVDDETPIETATARDIAEDEKRKIMREMGKKGGRASAEKRRKKKEAVKDGLQS